MLWVADTSSILTINQKAPRSERRRIYAALTELVNSGSLFYPIEVFREMEAYKTRKNPDPPYDWCKGNKDKATVHGLDVAKLQLVMGHPQACKVLDPLKSSGPEEADPYVLALALKLKEQDSDVTVITDETKTTDTKLAMSQACGLLKLYSVSAMPFLEEQGIYPEVPIPARKSEPTR